MRIGAFVRGIALALTFVAFALVLTTCGSGKRAVNHPSFGSGGLQTAESMGSLEAAPPTVPLPQSLEDALAELEGMECPEGVEEALWVELKDALGEALFCRAGGFPTRPQVAHA